MSLTLAGSDTLRVAVIGYGRWGVVHLDAYSRNPRTELVAVCGRDTARAHSAGASHCPRCTSARVNPTTPRVSTAAASAVIATEEPHRGPSVIGLPY
jgi:hypothetical protein